MKVTVPANVKWIERYDHKNRVIFMNNCTREIDVQMGTEYIAHFLNGSKRTFMADLMGFFWSGPYENEVYNS